jgi:mannose/cellobiose epimerase-like protein (N-acyl-D-glucosamine 2-epimerase family)
LGEDRGDELDGGSHDATSIDARTDVPTERAMSTWVRILFTFARAARTTASAV